MEGQYEDEIAAAVKHYSKWMTGPEIAAALRRNRATRDEDARYATRIEALMGWQKGKDK